MKSCVIEKSFRKCFCDSLEPSGFLNHGASSRYQIPKIRFDLTRGSRLRSVATRSEWGGVSIAGLPPIAGHLIAGAEIKIKKYFVTFFSQK